MKAIAVEALVKDYGKLRAVDNISFEVEAGEIFGLIGPNGAGKTTTLRILSTILNKTSGSVKIFGFELGKDDDKIRKIISYLPEEAGAYKNLTGLNYLEFMADFYAVSKNEFDEMLERGVKISDLGDRINDKFSTYSKGMARKLLLARSLMHLPKLAILDEPTSGLDVINSIEVRNIIKEFVKEGVTVLLSSHNMLEVEFLSDRVALIDRGKILEIGTPKGLKEKYHANNLEEVFVEVVQ
ncbi:MAG: ABC transporter ATP-binding protein [Candidatus Atribacteria bacterium]|nr:ABC transporter ATP-binding protein [Candidatus Atribacteria bacterium]